MMEASLTTPSIGREHKIEQGDTRSRCKKSNFGRLCHHARVIPGRFERREAYNAALVHAGRSIRPGFNCDGRLCMHMRVARPAQIITAQRLKLPVVRRNTHPLGHVWLPPFTAFKIHAWALAKYIDLGVLGPGSMAAAAKAHKISAAPSRSGSASHRSSFGSHEIVWCYPSIAR
jgi:hypothetical protein